MIKSKEDLRAYINEDNNFLRPICVKAKIIDIYTYTPMRLLRRYLSALRKMEYYLNTSHSNKFKKFLTLFYERKKNRLGLRLGIEIGPNCFERGLQLWHAGCIVVNPDARIGKNCILHGCNCIGNDGKSQKAPTIGDNVEIGYGANVIGDITIADNIVIGANALVNKSFEEPGITIAGCPARKIK